MSEWLGIALLWILLYGYVMVASIDFGAGFFASYETVSGEKHGMNEIINQFLSPFWESISVLLLLIMMIMVFFFSTITRLFGPSLFIPCGVALILMLLRGVFYLLNRHGSRYRKVTALLYGGLGLFIPVVLSSILTLSEGGFLNKIGSTVTIYFNRLFTNFYSWTVIFLSIVSVLYISALFLSFFANRVGDELALEKLRGYALFWSGPTVFASALVFVALENQNPEHFLSCLNVAWMFLASLVCLLGAVTFVFRKKRLGVAFMLGAMQYFFAFFGYGISHLPYIIYPYVKVKQLSHFHGLYAGLSFALIMGLALLLPSFILVLRLVSFKQTKTLGDAAIRNQQNQEDI